MHYAENDITDIEYAEDLNWKMHICIHIVNCFHNRNYASNQ
jgi:hypothetical protein